jgi:aryl-alcohol dehydrogenase-like predicted oxidoreductase
VYNIKNYSLDSHYQSPENKIRLTTLREVADELRATPIQVVIAWLIQSKPEVIPILGVDNKGQLDDNLHALDIELSEDQIFKLSTAGNITSSHFDKKEEVNRLAK